MCTLWHYASAKESSLDGSGHLRDSVDDLYCVEGGEVWKDGSRLVADK